MEKQCTLAKSHGVEVGFKYHNDLSAKQFLFAQNRNKSTNLKNISGSYCIDWESRF